MKRLLRGCLLSLALPLATLQAQQPAPGAGSWVNRPLEIGPGERVLVLSRVLVDRGPGMQPGGRLDYRIRTGIPSADVAARESQALRVARALGEDARDARVRMMSVAICDTEGCATGHEPPTAWFVFEKAANGVWQRMRR